MSLHKLSVDVADGAVARALADALEALGDPAPEAVTLFEQGLGWRIEAYVAGAPDVEHLHRTLEARLGLPLPKITASPVPDDNWVAVSQAALPPVAAGRFVVHGGHDAGRVARGPGTILIDAGEAFGTAHHATTRGCLLAIDKLTRRHRFRRVLDLGCGSGVLAIAAARALAGAVVLATDSDPIAVRVARENVRANRVAGRVDAFVANGLQHPRLRESGAFDLVLANILADPLIELAPGLARVVRSGGMVVLSGLLVPQAPTVIAAYRAAGFRLAGHLRIAGWSTLVLIRAR